MKRAIVFLLLLIKVALLDAQVSKQPNSNTYAVIIGISQYDPANTIPALKYAHRDAQEFAEYLKSVSGGSVPPENIRLLLNDNATVAAVYQAMNWLLLTCQKDDLVFIYFAGHGDKESQTIFNLGFLLTYNTPRFNYINNALRIEDLNNFTNTLSNNNNANVILITDACHSGDLAGKGFRGSYLVGDALRKVKKKEIRITSCDTDQLSVEGSDWGGGRGVFSWYLVNGLKGQAVRNGQGTISLGDIQVYLDSCFAADRILEEDHVKEHDKKQNPVLKGDERFVLAKVDTHALSAVKAMNINPLARNSALRPLPMQPVDYFFSLFKQPWQTVFKCYYDSLKGVIGVRKELAPYPVEDLVDFTKLAAVPVASIPAVFVQLAFDSIKQLRVDLSTPGKDDQPPAFSLYGVQRVNKMDSNYRQISIDTVKIENLLQSLRSDSNARNRFNNRLMVLLYDRGQEVINLYLGGDIAELERHRYYNKWAAGYDVYTTMLDIARKLTSPSDALYRMLAVNEHYFNGVNLMTQLSRTREPGVAERLVNKAFSEQMAALQLESNAAYIFEELGDIYAWKKEYANAVKNYTRATEIAPAWAIPWADLISLYGKTGQFAKAIDATVQASALQPGIQEIYVASGGVYQQTGNLLMAEEAYRKSIKINSRYYLPFEKLGEVYLQTTQYYLADSIYTESEKRKELDDTYNESPYPRHLLLPKSFPDSLFEYSPDCPVHVEDVGKKDVIGLCVLGIIAYRAGDTVLAEKYLKASISIDKKNLLALHYLGKMLFLQKRWQEGELILKMAIDAYVDSAGFRYYCDQMDRQPGETPSKDCIIRFFKESYAYYFSKDLDHFLLGTLYENWGHFSEAEEQFRTIINMEPKALGGFLKLWDMLEKTGRYHDAEEVLYYYHYTAGPAANYLLSFYKRMIERYPDQEEWYYKTGLFLYHLVATNPDEYYYDIKEISPDTYEEVFVRPERKRLPEYLYGKKYIIPGTNEIFPIPYSEDHPMTNGILYLKKADSLFLAEGKEEFATEISQKIGDLYVWQGLPEKSIPFYRKTLETEPGNANIRSKLAGICSLTWQYRDAMEQLESLYHQQEINFNDQLTLARYFIHSGRFTEADTLLTRSQQIRPYKTPDIGMLYGRLNLLSNQPKKALPFYQDLLSNEPADSMTMYTIARIYAMAGDRAQAVQWLKTSIKNGFNYHWVLQYDPVWEFYRRNNKKEWSSLVPMNQIHLYYTDNK